MKCVHRRSDPPISGLKLIDDWVGASELVLLHLVEDVKERAPFLRRGEGLAELDVQADIHR